MTKEQLEALRAKKADAWKAVEEARNELDSTDAGVAADARAKFDRAYYGEGGSADDFRDGGYCWYEREVETAEQEMDADRRRIASFDETARRLNDVNPRANAQRPFSADRVQHDQATYSRAFWDAILYGRDTPAETLDIIDRGQPSHHAEMMERLAQQGVRGADVASIAARGGMQSRALLAGSGDGANVVPTTLLDQLVIYAAPSYPVNGTRETPFAFYQTPDTGPFEVPHIDDNANTASEPGEATAVTGQTDPAPGKLTLNTAKTDSGVIDLAEGLLVSDVVGIEQAVARLLAVRVSRRLNSRAWAQLVATSGGLKAIAFNAAGTRQFRNATDGAVTVAEFEDLVWSRLDEQSQTSPNLFMMMSAGTRGQLLRQKTNGIKDWQEGVGGAEGGPPSTIGGARVWLNGELATPSGATGSATGDNYGLCGDGSHFHTRMGNGGISIRRSTEGGYGFANDVVGIKAVAWFGSGFSATRAFALLINR